MCFLLACFFWSCWQCRAHDIRFAIIAGRAVDLGPLRRAAIGGEGKEGGGGEGVGGGGRGSVAASFLLCF